MESTNIKKWIILLNGPPGAGKDTLANFMSLRYNFTHVKMSMPPKKAFCAAFGMSMAWLEANKDSHVMENGLTIRTNLISFIEEWLKPQFGAAVLGEMMHRHLQKEVISKHVIISDAGQSAETTELCRHYDAKMPLIIQITRPGCSFDQDSREYVTDHSGKSVMQRIDNNDTVKQWLMLGSYAICRHTGLTWDETLVPKV